MEDEIQHENQGFDDLGWAVVEQAKREGVPYRLTAVGKSGEAEVLTESPGYVDTADDYEIFLLSSASNDAVPVMSTIESELAGSSEDTVLIGHSVGAVRQHRLAERLRSKGTDVDLFVSIDMKNFFWFPPTSMPDNVSELLVFYSDPTREQREESGIQPRGVKSFRVDRDSTNILGEVAIQDVHTEMDSHPEVHERILREVERLRSGGVSIEDLKRAYETYTTPPSNSGRK